MSKLFSAVCVATAVLLTAAPAVLASEASQGPSVPNFLIQIALLLIFGRLLGEAAHRYGQPSVIGHLIAGIVLGPSVFGFASPGLQEEVFPNGVEHRQLLEGVSQLGVTLLLLLTGMEMDFALVSKVKRAAVSVSLNGIAIPFALGTTVGLLMPAGLLPNPDLRIVTALFLGTALSISSVKILAMVVREVNFARRDLGQVMLAAAIIDDTVGWVVIGIVLGIAKTGHIEFSTLLMTIAGTGVFLIASFTIGRSLVARAIRVSNDHFKSEFPVVTTIIVVTCLMALATHAIGVHTVLGAFVAGAIIGQSPILTRHIDEQLRGLIGALFAPVFFGLAGLSADLTVLANPRNLILTTGLVAIASVGKFTGAFVGGELAGLTRRESLALGCGMNARGSTEVIVATIGLSMGALSRDLYTMIVTMAVVTTLAMPPMLRWALGRIPMRDDERKRLELEAMESQGFVPQIERILVAVDQGPNGRLGARLAGLLAGSRKILTTVLQMDGAEPAASGIADTDAHSGEVVRQAVKEGYQNATGAAAPDVTVQPMLERGASKEAVEREAQKGFDILVIGLDDAGNAEGAAGSHVKDLVTGFKGPFMLVVAKGALASDPQLQPLKIFLAVNGTSTSRRAAEIAIEIARAAQVSLTAIHVAYDGVRPQGRTPSNWPTFLGTDDSVSSVLREIVEIANQYDVVVRTQILRRKAPADAILSVAKSGSHTLLVMGVNVRPGEQLNFGTVAATLLRDAPCSLLLIAS